MEAILGWTADFWSNEPNGSRSTSAARAALRIDVEEQLGTPRSPSTASKLNSRRARRSRAMASRRRRWRQHTDADSDSRRRRCSSCRSQARIASRRSNLPWAATTPDLCVSVLSFDFSWARCEMRGRPSNPTSCVLAGHRTAHGTRSRRPEINFEHGAHDFFGRRDRAQARAAPLQS